MQNAELKLHFSSQLSALSSQLSTLSSQLLKILLSVVVVIAQMLE